MRELGGQNILVVEDDALVASDLATILADRGAVVMVAASSKEAIAMIDRCVPDAAFIDVCLNDENSDLICRRLSTWLIPFAFHTGYGIHPESWPFAPLIAKPATYNQIVSCAQRMCLWTTCDKHINTTTQVA